ncbi:MAG: hypothetical protein E7420_04970 [Ruminococcaceae bacterium]|nr:hypothetical protein [Oscillospiraceae bacterium]
MSAKKIVAVILAACIMLSAAGCGSIFSSEYYYSEPFREEDIPENDADAEIRDQQALKNAILELVEAGETIGQFRFGSYSGALQDDLAAVCHEIKTSTPIGAYAVEDISYDTSRIVSYYTATLRIDYKRSAAEIAAVEDISGLAELRRHILDVMASHSPLSVIEIYSTYASEDYIGSIIRDNYYSDPLLATELPAFTVEAFPDSGPERIYRIEFKYSKSDIRLSEMLKELENRVLELAQKVSGADELNRVLSAARLISESCVGEDSAENKHTAYGCLVEGSDSPMAMAMAYKALCNELGITCHVVRGARKDSQELHYGWNIVEIDGSYYHMDLSRMDEGYALALLLSDDDMWGRYDWDSEKYPECCGSLSPEGVFGGNPVENIPQQTEPAPPVATPEPENSTENNTTE